MSNPKFMDIYKHSLENDRKQMEKMECPKCKAKMMEFGAITIKKKDGEIRHCARCYGDWLAKNIPIYALPELPQGKDGTPEPKGKA